MLKWCGLLLVVVLFGACVGCAGDADSNGTVNFDDIVSVLVNWLSICP